MIIFRRNIIFLIFMIAITFTKAVHQSSTDQHNELDQENAGTSDSDTESQSKQDDITRDPKRLKTDASDIGNETVVENPEKPATNDPKPEEMPTDDESEKFPEVILDYFTNPEYVNDERLDNPNSNEESNNDSCKKSVFEFEKQLPFVVHREKLIIEEHANFAEKLLLLNEGTTYFQASTLLLETLTMEEIKNPKNKNKLNEFLRQKNITDNDFSRHKYYYFLYSSGSEKKRLIPACPDDKEVQIEFGSTTIVKEALEKIDTVLETQYEVDEHAVFSSNEEDDTESPSASPEHPNSKIKTSPSSSPRHSNSIEPMSANEEIQTESQALPSPNATNASAKLNQSEYSSPKDPRLANVETRIESPVLLSSPSSTIATAKANKPLTRTKSSIRQQIKKVANMFDLTPLRFRLSETSKPVNKPAASAPGVKESEQPETITITNTFKGKLLKRGKSIKKDKYNAFNSRCTAEVKPTYVKENAAEYAEKYYVGYLVDFGTRVYSQTVHFLSIDENMLWFHIGHLLMDPKTKDTYSMFSYAPFYETVFEMENIPIYTDYSTEEDTIGSLTYYTKMYSEENQKKVFESFGNHEKYFDPKNGLVLVQQELMDQKSVPLMHDKRAALNYMNIAPMYKVIKDKTWSKVENVVLKVPFITSASTIKFVTGTYGSLKINDSAEGVYLDMDGEFNKTKRIKVPYAFYKIMHIEYESPKLKNSIPEHKKFFFSIVIVTHNDPNEKPKPQKICDKPVDCGSVGWKKVEQENPKFGYTYCCEWTSKLSEDMKIVPMYASLTIDEVLDLKTLYYVELTKTSHPLQRYENAIVEELNEACRAYSASNIFQKNNDDARDEAVSIHSEAVTKSSSDLFPSVQIT